MGRRAAAPGIPGAAPARGEAHGSGRAGSGSAAHEARDGGGILGAHEGGADGSRAAGRSVQRPLREGGRRETMNARTTPGRAASRGAFTLLEMAVVMWALGLLLLLGVATLLGVLRVQK